MEKARKYSLDLQHKEVSLVGKARKYSLDFQQGKHGVSLVEGKARKASRISSIKRLIWRERQGNSLV